MKKFLSLSLAVIMLLALFGCANKTPVGDGVPDVPQTESVGDGGSDVPQTAPVDLAKGATVACCMAPIDHPILRIFQHSFCTKAEELGMNPIVSGPSSGGIHKMQELMNIWERDIACNSAAGVLMWVGDDSCYEMMKTLKEQGLYIVVPSFEHEYENTKDFIDVNYYTNNKMIGESMADAMVEALQEKGIESGTICITDNGPSFGGWPSEYFRERMALYPQYTIADSYMEGAEVIYGADKAQKCIENNPDIVGAFCVIGESWEMAMERTGKTDIVVIARQWSEGIVDLINDEVISGYANVRYDLMGSYSANALSELINGKTYNHTEESWANQVAVPVATKNGQGDESIQLFNDTINAAQNYFKE